MASQGVSVAAKTSVMSKLRHVFNWKKRMNGIEGSSGSVVSSSPLLLI